MEGMSYNEFAEAMQQFFNEKLSGDNLIFAISLLVCFFVFLVWFIFYLRKQYLIRKKTVDTFEPKIREDLQYPGFHMNKMRNEVKPPKDDKGDKWGKIDDE